PMVWRSRSGRWDRRPPAALAAVLASKPPGGVGIFMALSTHNSPGVEEERYRRRTPASERCYLEARRYLPGGDSRSPLFYPPYPAVMQRGEGCRLFDLDGNELLDFTGNHSALAVGYGQPHILTAARRQPA